MDKDLAQPVAGSALGTTRRRFALAALLAWALFLRLPLDNSRDAGWTLERVDEVHYLEIAQRFLVGDWDVRYYTNPTFYAHVLHAVSRAVGLVRVAVGLEPSFETFAVRQTVDPRELILCGRALSVAASVLTVAILVAIGRKLFSPSVGWIAGLALATDLIATQRAAVVGNESLMTFLVALAFLVRIGRVDSPSMRRLVLGGFLIGLATSTKYSAGIFLVPMLLFRPFTPARLAGVAAAALAGFVAGSPGLLLHVVDFAQDFSRQYGFLNSGYIDADAARQQSGFVFYVASFPSQNLGIAFALACAGGILGMLWRAVRRRDFRCVLVLAAAVPLYFFLGVGIFHYPRFLLPAVPSVLLAGAVAIAATTNAIGNWIRRRRGLPFETPVPPAAALLLGLVLVAPGARMTWNMVTSQARAADPRVDAITWAKELIPAHARCCELALAEPFSLFWRTSVVLPAASDPVLLASQAREIERFEASGRWRDTRLLGALMEGARTLAEVRSRIAQERIDYLVIDLEASVFLDPMSLPKLTRYPALRDFTAWSDLFAWLATKPQIGRRVWRSGYGPVVTTVIDLR